MPLPVEPTPRCSFDVHAADCMGGIHCWQFPGLLKRSNTSCGERLIKTLNVNIAIVYSPLETNQDRYLALEHWLIVLLYLLRQIVVYPWSCAKACERAASGTALQRRGNAVPAPIVSR
jgi:hypothetical protein